MAIVKVIEILSESKNGWEAAAQEAVAEASKTINDIQSIYIENFQAIVDKGKIVNYRVNCKISFIVNH